MKTVILTYENYKTKEVEVPEGVIRQETSDYQDNYTSKYFKYYYINKKGETKECKIKWV